MAVTESAYMLECWEAGICPFCRKSFPARQRVGDGRKKAGGFCSLTCFVEYYKLSLVERHEHILGKAGKTDGPSQSH
jgi:hypothetical protein